MLLLGLGYAYLCHRELPFADTCTIGLLVQLNICSTFNLNTRDDFCIRHISVICCKASLAMYCNAIRG